MKLERAEKCNSSGRRTNKQTFVLFSTPWLPSFQVSPYHRMEVGVPCFLTMTLALKIKGEKSI